MYEPISIQRHSRFPHRIVRMCHNHTPDLPGRDSLEDLARRI
jgi:hypothetical protein